MLPDSFPVLPVGWRFASPGPGWLWLRSPAGDESMFRLTPDGLVERLDGETDVPVSVMVAVELELSTGDGS